MHKIDLDRFLLAQRDVYDTALQEVRAGKKRTHWMWFVFPQVAGLGSSKLFTRYAIGSIEEAKAYLAHPVLGERLRAITRAMNNAAASNPVSIVGSVDAMKFQFSMTLFESASVNHYCFRTAIDKFFGRRPDEGTVRQIAIWRKETDS